MGLCTLNMYTSSVTDILFVTDTDMFSISHTIVSCCSQLHSILHIGQHLTSVCFWFHRCRILCAVATGRWSQADASLVEMLRGTFFSQYTLTWALVFDRNVCGKVSYVQCSFSILHWSIHTGKTVNVFLCFCHVFRGVFGGNTDINKVRMLLWHKKEI